jgi:hypothetical protein
MLNVKNLKTMVLVIGFMLCLSMLSFADIVNSGAYYPTIFPYDVATVWEDRFPDKHGDSVIAIDPDDPGNDYVDVLYIDTTSSISNQVTWKSDINADNDTDTIVVVAKVKLHSYTGNYLYGGCNIVVGNGTKEDQFNINPDGILLFTSGGVYNGIDPTDGYHEYKIELDKDYVKVYVDGGTTPVISEASATPIYWEPRNMIAFGSSSGGASSEASWAFIEYQVTDNQ